MSVRQPTKAEQCFSFLLKKVCLLLLLQYTRCHVLLYFCWIVPVPKHWSSKILRPRIAEFINEPCKSYTTNTFPRFIDEFKAAKNTLDKESYKPVSVLSRSLKGSCIFVNTLSISMFFIQATLIFSAVGFCCCILS